MNMKQHKEQQKKSGSIETISPTNTSGANLLTATSGTSGIGIVSGSASASGGGGDVSPVGTWKLIKGKVSQTIEDIKSSKGSSGGGQVSTTVTTAGGKGEPHEGSEAESDYFAASTDDLAEYEHIQYQHNRQHHGKGYDTDSDGEQNEVILETDGDRSRLKRGFANLKSKVKTKAAAHHHRHHHHSPQHSADKQHPDKQHSDKHHLDKHQSDKHHPDKHHQDKQHPDKHHPDKHHPDKHHQDKHHQDKYHPEKQQLQAHATSGNLSAASSTSSLKMNKDLSPSRTSSSTSSLRSHFLRKRQKHPVETAELATPSSTPDTALGAGGGSSSSISSTTHKAEPKPSKGIVSGRKEVHEIESGVEMLEDMVPPPSSLSDIDKSFTSTNIDQQQKRQGMELPLKSISNEFLSPYGSGIDSMGDEIGSGKVKTSTGDSNRSGETAASWLNFLRDHGKVMWSKGLRHAPAFTVLTLTAIILAPIPDFIRGVFACLLTIVLLETVTRVVQSAIEYFLVTNPPEHTKFQIPDYSKMPICEIPAVEEHKTVKTYAGWMNEVNSYDPNTFHISMTKTVYVRLNGTILHMATTTARIPKRVMWNEPPIDKKTVTFTEQRTYNLLGCRIELLPLGLARKRYFNRKYPIQLIIKNCGNNAVPSEQSSRTGSKRPSSGSHHRVAYEDVELDVHESKQKFVFVSQPNSGESLDDSERPFVDVQDSELDFSSTVLNADLQILNDLANPDGDSKDMTVPCGDEVRLLLFTRGDREKEDWYRRFVAASTGDVHDQDLRLPNVKFVSDTDLQAAAAKAAILLTADSSAKSGIAPEDTAKTATVGGTPSSDNIPSSSNAKSSQATPPTTTSSVDAAGEQVGDAEAGELETTIFPAGPTDDNTFEGLLMTGCAARNPPDYIRFMALYQRRRAKRQEDELWKGIDQSLFLGPSGSVVWLNVLVGRVLYSCLNDALLHGKIQEFLQKKLSSIKLPSFMEDVVITQINLGDTPPLIHRVSRPMLDERGTWLDADITYEGLLQITVTTKLNLLRLRRQAKPAHISMDVTAAAAAAGANLNLPPINVIPDDITTGSIHSVSSLQQDEQQLMDAISGSAIFDSDAESSGGSSSEAESPVAGATNETNNATEFNVFNTSPGNARRIFKIVDRFASSNFFQYATELSYVQRAMENMSANITLRVDLKGLVGRGIINLPPPPSDRIWLAFRGPPRLWITAKPAVGDKSLDWSIVTNVIESKLCEGVNKYLVFPNMVDVTIPFLGQPTYNRE